MKNTKTFTSTISPDLLGWLDTQSRRTKKTRRELIEDAIRRYRVETKRKQMREGFKRAATDSETIEIAEWGMGDYQDITKSI